MSSESKQTLTRLQGAVVDGRLANAFFRREQLSHVHDGLLRAKTEVLAATVKDSGNTPAEALVEFYMVLSAVRLFHDQIKPSEELELEYRIANGKDATESRVAIGIVLITPQEHTYVYSVLAPLCAALAAGNAVAIVMDNTRRVLPSMITRILRHALDPDIFEVVKQVKIEDASTSVIHVDQGGTLDERRNILYSPSTSLTIGIVDRTADIEGAAETLTRARFSFGGTSPYAPDIVLVNEFAKEDFLRAVLKQASGYLTGESNEDKAEETPSDGFRTLISQWGGVIVEVEDRNALIRLGKTGQKRLSIHPFRSLDDAIETANGLGYGRPLAAYVFADSKTSKYVLQFVDADIGLANIIPTELLVGPALPRCHGTAISTRYTTDLFSTPRPLFADKSGLSLELEGILGAPDPAAEEGRLSRKVVLEKRAPVTHSLGYFERGIIVGGITTVSSAVLGLGVVIYYTAKMFVLQ